jgi:hypothetical protein
MSRSDSSLVSNWMGLWFEWWLDEKRVDDILSSRHHDHYD